jgi:protocatechuate 3,4-dioxygenase beta subunit
MLIAGAPAVFAARARWFGVDDADAAASVLAATSPDSPSRRLTPTPDCGDDDEPTPAVTEGPFFKPRSPLRTSLIEPGMNGPRISLAGLVFSKACRPIPGALVDFWQADPDGEYDNAGFKLRGHQFTDAEGRYRLETLVPGLYGGRTRHFHVKVQAPHGRILTSQLFFPGEPRNRSDFIFRPDLLMWLRNANEAREARFNFVLRTD